MIQPRILAYELDQVAQFEPSAQRPGAKHAVRRLFPRRDGHAMSLREGLAIVRRRRLVYAWHRPMCIRLLGIQDILFAQGSSRPVGSR